MKGHGRMAAPAGVFLGCLLVYAAFPTKQFYWDGIGFASQIERAAAGDPTPLAHANHLLYNYAGYGLFLAASAAGLAIRSLWLLQGLNIVLAAFSALLVYRLVRKEGASEYAAVSLAAIFAFGATWWKFAADADAYVPAVFLLLCTWSLLRDERVPSWAAGVVHGTAMLFHQLALLFFPVAILVLWRKGLRLRSAVNAAVRPAPAYRPREATACAGISPSAPASVHPGESLAAGNPPASLGRGEAGTSITGGGDAMASAVFPVRQMAAYTAIAAAIAVGGYAITYRLLFMGRPGGFLGWITDHSHDSGFNFNPLRSALLTLGGTLRLLFGGRLDALRPEPLPIAALVFLAATAAALAVRRPALRLVRGKWSRIAPLVAWVASYSLFLFFWMPQNSFYRLFYWPALVLAAGAVLGRSRYWRPRGGLAALAAIIFLWNFAFMAYPNAQRDANETLTFARAQQARWAPATGIVFGIFHPDLWTIAYFNPQTSWIPLDPENPAALDALRPRLSGMWLEATAYDALQRTEKGRRWLEGNVESQPSIDWRTGKREFRFHRCRP